MTTIFPFTSPELPSLDQAGGKALALMQMTAAGMPVPPGFVLTVKFFEPWLDMLKHIARRGLRLAKTAEIGQAAKAFQGLCGTLEFTEIRKTNSKRSPDNLPRAKSRTFVRRPLIVAGRRSGRRLLCRRLRNHAGGDGGRYRSGHPPFVYLQFR